MQNFILLYGSPVYAFSIILACLFLSTGLGSFLSDRMIGGKFSRIRRFLWAGAGLILIYYKALPAIIHSILHLEFYFKFFITVLLILPLGILLGFFFPQAVKKLGEGRAELIPWAWSINGFATILGSMLSIYLSLIFGFSFFLLTAAVIYFAISFVRWDFE